MMFKMIEIFQVGFPYNGSSFLFWIILQKLFTKILLA